MRRLWVSEPIRVIHSPEAFVPKSFTWRAQEHRVWKVEAVQDERIERMRGAVNRKVYKVRTHRGMRCSISYDELRKRWQIDSVSLQGGVA